MAGSIGPLLPSDEGFNHQIVDTFATVSQSDYSWTEKVCGMAGMERQKANEVIKAIMKAMESHAGEVKGNTTTIMQNKLCVFHFTHLVMTGGT